MKIKGIVAYRTIKDNKVEVIDKGPNSMTALGDMYYKAKALQGNAAIRGIEEGFDFIVSKQISVTSSTVTLAGVNDNLAVYLLNLSEVELANLTAENNLLPIYTPGTFEIDHSKVVGWASIDRTSTEAKQGVFDVRSAEDILDDWKTSLTWSWASGKISGSFNCVAIGINVMNSGSSRFNGFSVHKGLESNDVIAGESVASGCMLRPGVTGITSPTEIILGGTTTGLGRIKYDLVSKTRTELQPTDAGYDFPLIKADRPQVIIGNRLFYIASDNYVWVYDMTAKTHTKSTINTNNYTQTLFSYNGYLYIGIVTATFAAYNPITLSAVKSADLTLANMNISHIFNSARYCAVANYGNNYIITWYYNVNLINSSKRAIVVSDLSDVGNSIINILPMVRSASNYTINNEQYMFDYYLQDDIYKSLSGIGTVTNFGNYGVKYSKYAGNMISFKTYDTPQTIPTDQVSIVDYAYKYGD